MAAVRSFVQLLRQWAATRQQPLVRRPLRAAPPQPPDPFGGLTPRSLSQLRTEAHIALIAAWFLKTIDVPGDVCEFGCFRGTMSIKFAAALKALDRNKTVFAFDTFEGFQIDDPAGGALGAGAYSDNEDAFEELQRWSRLIPVRPVKGDARETCKQLAAPLSFVWLDLDFDVLMDPVLDGIWPLLGDETIVGIDDVGRPETPGVEPWVDRVTQAGRLIELARYADDFIRFYKPARNAPVGR